MENISSFRIVNIEEKEEIDRLASNALIYLSLNNLDQSDVILKKMDEVVESFNSIDTEDLEKYGYEFGSLFGNIIRKEYGWEWYWVNADDEIFYCITSPQEKVCCICHNFFYSILKKEHSNNFRLLFNLIKKQYPKNWNFMILS